MVKRRPLAEGLKPSPQADPERERAFLSEARKAKRTPTTKTAKPKSDLAEPAAIPLPPASDIQAEPQPEQSLGRSPLTTRLRSDIATALKRASLERQLAGQSPHTVQDILELVLEPWLKTHGYLK